MNILFLPNSFKSQTGSFGVIFALFLVIIIGILAFVLNLGFLYAGKNKYQNAVEAAARAGAASLCDENPELTAREILLENLGYSDFPDGYTVEIQRGYYDENGEYDFSGTSSFGYKAFVEEENIPYDEYVNSIFVRLTVDQKNILPGFLGDAEDTTVQVNAVAYLKRYGMLSLGEGSGDGITFTNYYDNEPAITNGNIHANNNITFDASPDIDSDSVNVTASGTISGYRGESGVDQVSIKSISSYLDDLYERADKIITEDDFPDTSGEEYTDDDGNVYTRTYIRIPPTFQPHIGDHGGIIYFFDGDVNVQLQNIDKEGEDITNLIFASRKSIYWRLGNHSHNWGGENEKQVTIVAGEDIVFGSSLYSDSNFDAMGVVLLAGRDILWRNTSSHGVAYYIRNVRMIAERNINLTGPYANPGINVEWNMNFGPPCPPYDVRLGLLETP